MHRSTLHELSATTGSYINVSTENRDDPPSSDEEIGGGEDKGLAKPESGEMADSCHKKPSNKESPWSDIFGNGELKIKTIKQGTPNTRPQPLDVCDIKFLGRLENGMIIENFECRKIQIGDHEIVHGLELALPLMNVGEKALVVVSPRFAYGSIGDLPRIPPNVTIRYVLELIRAEMSPPLENIPHEKRKALANLKRERGNWWYARHDATKAVRCYMKAIDLLDETISYVTPEGEVIENTEDNIIIMVRDKVKIYNNLAAAQLKIEAYDSALVSVAVVLRHQPQNVKALFRKGKILLAKGKTKEAASYLRQACFVEPNNTAVMCELNKCIKILENEDRDEKILCRRMLGQLVADKPVEKSAPAINKPRWNKVVKTAITASVMAAIAATLTYKFKNYPFL